MIVMLFDFSSMQPAEQVRAREAAIKFLTSQMTASDTVSIMTYTNSLKTVQDFTPDRDLLINTINRFRIGDSSENATFADEGADAQDQSGQFVADETEFNIFNADLKLAALEDAARNLGQYPEKKALGLYFERDSEERRRQSVPATCDSEHGDPRQCRLLSDRCSRPVALWSPAAMRPSRAPSARISTAEPANGR